MSIEMILLLIAVIVLLAVAGFFLHRKLPKKLKTENYAERWKELQGYCKDKQQWPAALIEADKLLDNALRRRRFKGKSMGERMVSAQRVFTNNDALWFAHNLCKKVLTDPDARLKEQDVKDALVGFRQALRDLGALPTNKEAQDGRS
jgi:hypothetical protein